MTKQNNLNLNIDNNDNNNVKTKKTQTEIKKTIEKVEVKSSEQTLNSNFVKKLHYLGYV